MGRAKGARWAKGKGPPFLLRYFLPVFMGAAGVMAVVLALFLHGELRIEQAILAARELAAVQLGQRALNHEFERATSDLFFLAESATLQDLLAHDTLHARKAVAAEFLSLACNKRRYRRIWYAAAEGGQGIKAEFRDCGVMLPDSTVMGGGGEEAAPWPVNAASLGRDRFVVVPAGLAGGGAGGDIFTTLRFWAAVFDGTGTWRGMIGLDFFSATLADHLRTAMGQRTESAGRSGQIFGRARLAGEAMLLDGEGAWLMAPDLEEGGRLRGKERVFAKLYPEAWQRLGSAEQGQFEIPEGLFTFVTVAPQLVERQRYGATGMVAAVGMKEGGGWKLVSRVSRSEREAFAAPYVRMAALLYGVLLLLLVLAGWQFARIRARHRQALEALRASEKKMRTITSVLGEGVCVLDRDGCLVFMNPEAEKLLGWSEAELLGKDLHEVIHFQTVDGEFLPAHRCPVLKAIAQGRTCRNQEDVFVHKDGRMVPVAVVSTPIIGGAGVEGSVVAFHDITARTIASRELERQAATDPLTGICNRLRFGELMEKELTRALRYETPLALIMFDIDHFKVINDSLGHQAGDLVLQELSQKVASHIRQLDVFARWGGEEFMVLVPNSDLEDGAQLAEKLRAMVASSSFSCGKQISCSFGVTRFREGDTMETLAQRADAAMYQAKRQGRNRVELVP